MGDLTEKKTGKKPVFFIGECLTSYGRREVEDRTDLGSSSRASSKSQRQYETQSQ